MLIQNVAAASNAKDWKHPGWKNFSYIEGSDVTGYFVKVREGVSELKGGERVAAFTPLDAENSKVSLTSRIPRFVLRLMLCDRVVRDVLSIYTRAGVDRVRYRHGARVDACRRSCSR